MSQYETLRQSVEDEMNPMALDALDRIVADLAARLGESPEAWRAVDEFSVTLTMFLDAAADLRDGPPSKFEFMLTALLFRLVGHPAAVAARGRALP